MVDLSQAPDKRPTLRLAPPNWLVPLVLPIVILVIWYTAFWINSEQGLLSPPHAIMAKIWEMTLTGEIFLHVGVSVWRVTKGFFFAAVTAIPLGLLLGWSRLAENFFEVVIHMVRTIPIMAWLRLTIMWFGMGELSSVLIVVLAAFFPMFFNTTAGVRGISQNLVEAAMTLGVRRNSWAMFREVIFPGALPMILTGMEIALGFAWSAIVAAELIFKNQGIGYLTMAGRIMLSIETVILGMFLICVCGFAFHIGIKKLQKIMLRWQVGLRSE